ncbi:MAG: thymidylate kinase [Clostridia bacterium]|nr:thymidylate kinase [Clostridia bacterium]
MHNRGKLIVIEGTDCSGKQTQADLLVAFLNENGIKTKKMGFPMYDTPTGKIIGGPYLGKDWICDGYFEEGASNVNPKVASLYYAADRKYNIDKVIEALNLGYNVILDRYVESNMAHQAGKISDPIAQSEMISWLDKLEYSFLELPRPDMTIFLHMPYEASLKLRMGREEKGDQHETDKGHMICAEKTYLLLARRYMYDTVKCVDENDNIRTIDDIAKEIQKIVFEKYYLTCQIDLNKKGE